MSAGKVETTAGGMQCQEWTDQEWTDMVEKYCSEYCTE